MDLSGGFVDALINTAYIGRSMNGTNTGTVSDTSGTLTFDTGTIDVNALEVGYQTSAIGTGPGGSGTVNVNGSALLQVNQLLQLAFGTINSPLEQGALNISGGTVQGTNIVGGGGISTINLTNGLLDLQGGRIANISTLNVGSASDSDPALLANACRASPARTRSSSPPMEHFQAILLSPSPGLTVNGVISPGTNGPGWMTNNVGRSRSARVEITSSQSRMRSPVLDSGWSILEMGRKRRDQYSIHERKPVSRASPASATPSPISATAPISIGPSLPQARSAISIRQISTWMTSAVLRTISSPHGHFYIRSNNNSLILSFTNNHPPAAAPLTLTPDRGSHDDSFAHPGRAMERPGRRPGPVRQRQPEQFGLRQTMSRH